MTAKITDIGKKKLDNQALEAQLFLEGFVESLGVLPRNDVAHLLSMVLADLAKSVLVDFHRQFCIQKEYMHGGKAMAIMIDNLIAYTNHMHEQLNPDESDSKH